MTETHASPDISDEQVRSLESTGFSAGNLRRTLVTMDAPPDYVPEGGSHNAWRNEIAAFVAVEHHIGIAEYRISVLAADLVRHRLSLTDRIRIRDAETQAKLSIDDVDTILAEVLSSREALFAIVEAVDAIRMAAAGNVPDASKTAAEQSAANDECGGI